MISEIKRKIFDMISVLSFDEYQEEAAKTALYPHKFYPFASIMIEAAELADLACKPMLRGDDCELDERILIAEAGDVLWNLAAILSDRGISLQDVADYNIKKLRDRKNRGVIQGSGGDR